MFTARRSGAIVATFLGAAGGPAEAQESYIAAGLGGSDTAAHAWQSATVTPFGGLDTTGLVIRALLTQLKFRYETSLPGDPSAVIEVYGVAGEAKAGWQWVDGDNRFALLAGAAARQYDLSPDDPGSDLEGFHWSTSVSALATVAVPQAPGWAVSGEATYRPQVNELWAQIRPGFDLGDGFRIGPEAAVSRGEDYLFGRFGLAVTGYRLTFTSNETFVGGAAGVSFDEGFSPSPYGGVWVGVKF